MEKTEPLPVIEKQATTPGGKLPFYLVLLYLFLEYGRPQESIPGLAAISLPAIVTVLIGMFLLFSGKLKLSDTPTKLYILLLILMVFHVPLATNNYWAFQIAKIMLITFVAYLGIITFVDTFYKFIKLINFWFVIHIYLAINGIIKEGRGIGGFLGDENDFCMTLNMIIPFAFFLALGEENKLKKIIYVGLIGLFLFTIILTFSRGGFLGLVGIGVYCWLKSPKKVVSGVLILLFIIFMSQFAPSKYWDEIKSIQEEGAKQGTGEERIYEWKIGWKMFKDNPILGVGQGNFPYRFGYYEGGEQLHERSRAGRAAHSLYFTLLPELGIIGTLIFGIMLYYIYKYLRFISQIRSNKKIAITTQEKGKIFYLGRAMEGSLIGFLVSGAFISILYYPNYWIMMGFILGLKKISEKEFKRNLDENRLEVT